MRNDLAMAIELHMAGRTAEAEAAYRSILSSDPRNAQALHYLGLLRLQQQDWNAGAELISRSLAIDPGSAEAHFHLGLAWRALGLTAEAAVSFEQATKLEPDYAEALSGLGNALLALGAMERAVPVFARLAELRPADAGAHYGHGFALLSLRRYPEALRALDRAISAKPDYPEAHTGRALALALSGRRTEALAAADRALVLNRDFVPALNIRSEIRRDLGALAASLEDCDRSLAVAPDQAAAHNNRGHALFLMGRLDAALAALNRALELDPSLTAAVCNRGSVLRNMGKPADALADFERVLAQEPDLGEVAGERFYLKSLTCDWGGRASDLADLERRVRAGQLMIPWEVLVALDDPEIQLASARRYAARFEPAAPVAGHKSHDRLRIAYLSPDFRDHPTGHQMAPLIEHHDKARFETFGICLNSVPDDPVRSRLKKAFDHFIEAGSYADGELSRLIADREIDIAVDLAGYVGNGRTKVLAAHPAPIVANYFGYPGTLGTGSIDYIIADRWIVPPGAEAFYAEKVVRLPDCYYPSEAAVPVVAPPRRADHGLPDGLIFCCFNNTYKITPQLFDIWMRLVKRVDGSVLWLFAENEAARRNLAVEAEARGVSRDRLVFADRVGHDRHLARLPLADLFLDTLPCNAHTTAIDALRAGVPLITCSGRSFAARVAGSMLHAARLPELIAGDLAQYEALALGLATSPQRLAALREKLARNHADAPLFDTARLCRNLERAYETMWRFFATGGPPSAFDIEATAS